MINSQGDSRSPNRTTAAASPQRHYSQSQPVSSKARVHSGGATVTGVTNSGPHKPPQRRTGSIPTTVTTSLPDYPLVHMNSLKRVVSTGSTGNVAVEIGPRNQDEDEDLAQAAAAEARKVHRNRMRKRWIISAVFIVIIALLIVGLAFSTTTKF